MKIECQALRTYKDNAENKTWEWYQLDIGSIVAYCSKGEHETFVEFNPDGAEILNLPYHYIDFAYKFYHGFLTVPQLEAMMLLSALK